MLKKVLFTAFVLLILLAWAGAETSVRRNVNSLTPVLSIPQKDCSDSAIRLEVINKLKAKYSLQKRKENFVFDVFVSNKVVTLKGFVSGEVLRDKVLNDVRKIVQQMNCEAKLDKGHNNDDKKDKLFRNSSDHHCQQRQVECPDGTCAASLSQCGNPFIN